MSFKRVACLRIGLKPVLNVTRSRLAKYLQRLRQDFAKSSPSLCLLVSEVLRKTRCEKQVGEMGDVAEADQTAHPIGWSVYDVAAWSSATVFEETPLTYG